MGQNDDGEQICMTCLEESRSRGVEDQGTMHTCKAREKRLGMHSRTTDHGCYPYCRFARPPNRTTSPRPRVHDPSGHDAAYLFNEPTSLSLCCNCIRRHGYIASSINQSNPLPAVMLYHDANFALSAHSPVHLPTADTDTDTLVLHTYVHTHCCTFIYHVPVLNQTRDGFMGLLLCNMANWIFLLPVSTNTTTQPTHALAHESTRKQMLLQHLNFACPGPPVCTFSTSRAPASIRPIGLRGRLSFLTTLCGSWPTLYVALITPSHHAGACTAQ